MGTEVNMVKLKEYYDSLESKIKTDAVVTKAYTSKLSSKTIENKVDSQLNSITASIHSINNKFTEGSKNYDLARQNILDTLTRYKENLVELSEFYDGKIEQLILSKVEIEASILGGIVNEEYLDHRIAVKKRQKEEDSLKKKINDNSMNCYQKIIEERQKSGVVDTLAVRHKKDADDISREIDTQMQSRIDKSVNDQKETEEVITKREKKIKAINEEIELINQRKVEAITRAMEEGGVFLTANVKKPRAFTRIKRFFISRFNTYKVIDDTIITPLNKKIEEFKKVELSSMKG